MNSIDSKTDLKQSVSLLSHNWHHKYNVKNIIVQFNVGKNIWNRKKSYNAVIAYESMYASWLLSFSMLCVSFKKKQEMTFLVFWQNWQLSQLIKVSCKHVSIYPSSCVCVCVCVSVCVSVWPSIWKHWLYMLHVNVITSHQLRTLYGTYSFLLASVCTHSHIWHTIDKPTCNTPYLK